MAATMNAALGNLRQLSRSGAGAPVLLLVILAMMVVPLPPFALDTLFTFNIALSLVVLLVTVYALRPLDFATFPTVLLVATLLRLALNVASTRVVLLEGHTGTAAAGRVIEAFGEFVVGGNYAVGLVVFAILVIINFVVVTKGAGRISEVSARFTLDAMPGKQMAIDADLNAGLINQEEALERREAIAREADFYGAMDGASKFVRGDAVAAILILFVNILGGLAIGVGQHSLSFAEAARNYVLLTIGDGLVAQIPSLVLSSAAGIIVTRVSSPQKMGEQMLAQMFGSPKALAVTAGVMGLAGLIPGMPNLVFLGLSAAAGYGAWRISRTRQSEEHLAVQERRSVEHRAAEQKELSWDDVPGVDPIGLDVGYGLIVLVDSEQGGELMGRIKGVRKKLSQDLGFLIPPVHIRDNLDLDPTVYRISLFGVPVGEAEVYPDRDLAINPGTVHGELRGTPTRDPTFGLEAVWIERSLRDQAHAQGYTVVDASTVVATHLSELIRKQAYQLLGHDEAQQLLDSLRRSAPRLVEDLVPKTLPLSVVVKVLQNLLMEGVPVRDSRSIAEVLAEQGPKSQDPSVLTAAVREVLGRLIVQHIYGLRDEIPVAALDPELERILQKSLQPGDGAAAALEPGLAERLQQSCEAFRAEQESRGDPAVLLVPGALRVWLSGMLRHGVPGLQVLSYAEIPDEKKVTVVKVVGRG